MNHNDHSTFDFPVERGKVREFLQATLPLLRAAGLPDTWRDSDPAWAPTVFSRVADFYQPDNGSMAELIGREPPRLRHAGHSWRVLSPLRTGRTYRVAGWRTIESIDKRGRDGQPFRLVTMERTFAEQSGETVLLEQGVIAVLDGPLERVAVATTHHERDETTGGIANWNADWRSASAGTALADITIPALGLTDIVRFAGAIGDFNPIHHDTEAARASGLPDIIAMGMFGCTLASLAIEHGYSCALTNLTVRFREPLFAHRSLRLRMKAGDGADGDPAVTVEGLSGQAPILSITASARV